MCLKYTEIRLAIDSAHRNKDELALADLIQDIPTRTDERWSSLAQSAPYTYTACHLRCLWVFTRWRACHSCFSILFGVGMLGISTEILDGRMGYCPSPPLRSRAGITEIGKKGGTRPAASPEPTDTAGPLEWWRSLQCRAIPWTADIPKSKAFCYSKGRGYSQIQPEPQMTARPFLRPAFKSGRRWHEACKVRQST